MAYELSVCWLDSGVEEACLALFPGAGFASCPLFAEFVVATGWVAGEQTGMAQAEVSRCMSSSKSAVSYDVYFWTDIGASARSDQVLYSSFAYFDSALGEMLSLQRYQTNHSRALYPEVYCCDGEQTFGITYGSLLECNFESATKYSPSDFTAK
jgi:hypothetical protein